MFSSLFNKSDPKELFQGTAATFGNIDNLKAAIEAGSNNIAPQKEPQYVSHKEPLLDSVFQKMLYSDVTFLVDGQEFQAHKGIVAARCKFFEDLFASEKNESNEKVIKLDDISKDAFAILLKFIYNEDLNLTEDPALELLPIVNSKYSLPGLEKKLGNFLAKIVDLDNFARIIDKAEQMGNNSLKNAVLDFMEEKIGVITKGQDILKVSKEILVELLSRATFGEENKRAKLKTKPPREKSEKSPRS